MLGLVDDLGAHHALFDLHRRMSRWLSRILILPSSLTPLTPLTPLYDLFSTYRKFISRLGSPVIDNTIITYEIVSYCFSFTFISFVFLIFAGLSFVFFCFLFDIWYLTWFVLTQHSQELLQPFLFLSQGGGKYHKSFLH